MDAKLETPIYITLRKMNGLLSVFRLSDISLTQRRRGLAEEYCVRLFLRLVMAGFYWFGGGVLCCLPAVYGILRLESRSPRANASVHRKVMQLVSWD